MTGEALGLMAFRMFVIDRTRGGTQETPEETIDLAGTTGNVYSITICQLPSCTCPDSLKGNQCKHIVYVYLSHPHGFEFVADGVWKVLHNVFKAPEHLQYQLAFLSSVSSKSVQEPQSFH